MTEVKMDFRFVGDNVDPKHIARILTIEPARSGIKGESVDGHPDRRHRTGFWTIGSKIPETGSLDEHIRDLLGILGEHRASIQKLVAEGYDPNFFCSVFTSEPREYIRFDSDILTSIANLGASINIHIYTDPEISG